MNSRHSTANKQHKKSKLFSFAGCGVFHLLGPHPDHFSVKIFKALRNDDAHRINSDNKPRPGLPQLVSESLPLRLPLGELSESLQKSDVVRTGLFAIYSRTRH